MASGTLHCRMLLFMSGVWTVSLPTPLLRQAFAARDGCASHAVLAAYEQGMPLCCLLWAKGLRGLSIFFTSPGSITVILQSIAASPRRKVRCPWVLLHRDISGSRRKEGQFRKLDGQGQVRTDDGRRIIVCVVFAHQAGRDVDAHHFGRTGVDSFHESGIASVQRLIQSGTEQSVYDDIFFVRFRERELGRHFGEQQSGQVFQPVLLFRQSSLRRPVMLNRYVCTVYPALQSRRDTAKASPPLLPGPANTMKRVAVVQRLFSSAAIAFAARSIKSVDETVRVRWCIYLIL